MVAAYLKLLREAPEATVEIVGTDITGAVARYGLAARDSALRVRGMERQGQRDLFQFMQRPDQAWTASLAGSQWNCMSPAPPAGPSANH
jgi:hypothetical protein